MAAAMYQAFPSFYSDYNEKSLFISVSCDFYEKYIVTIVFVDGNWRMKTLQKVCQTQCGANRAAKRQEGYTSGGRGFNAGTSNNQKRNPGEHK